MCDGISQALMIASMAASAGGAAYSAIQADELNNKQEAANNAWANFQRQIRTDENARQEAERRKAEAIRQGQLDTLGVAKQSDMQGAEADRLFGDMGPKNDGYTAETIADKLLGGQKSGGTEFMDDAASKVTNATKAARDRIKALATVQSFGDSFGGLKTQNAINFGNSDAALGTINNVRGGSLKTFGVEQGVDPVHYTAGANLGGMVASLGAQVGGAMLGNKLGSK